MKETPSGRNVHRPPSFIQPPPTLRRIVSGVRGWGVQKNWPPLTCKTIVTSDFTGMALSNLLGCSYAIFFKSLGSHQALDCRVLAEPSIMNRNRPTSLPTPFGEAESKWHMCNCTVPLISQKVSGQVILTEPLKSTAHSTDAFLQSITPELIVHCAHHMVSIVTQIPQSLPTLFAPLYSCPLPTKQV